MTYNSGNHFEFPTHSVVGCSSERVPSLYLRIHQCSSALPTSSWAPVRAEYVFTIRENYVVQESHEPVEFPPYVMPFAHDGVIKL